MQVSASMPFTDRSDLIPRMVDYFLDHQPENTIEDIARTEQNVYMDEGRRIMQEAVFSWERREQQAYQEGFQKGFQIGFQIGVQVEDEKLRKQIAKRILAKGFEIDTICDLTDFTPDELEQLRNRLY